MTRARFSLRDALRCDRCKKDGDGIVAHPAIGKVCAFCWTPADEAIVYPGAAARRAAFDAACKAVQEKHPEKDCERLKAGQHIACPKHDRDDESEEE